MPYGEKVAQDTSGKIIIVLFSYKSGDALSDYQTIKSRKYPENRIFRKNQDFCANFVYYGP